MWLFLAGVVVGIGVVVAFVLVMTAWYGVDLRPDVRAHLRDRRES